MSKYTMSDVKEADRLWDEMPLREVSEQMDIPQSTLTEWSMKGLIGTETNHSIEYSPQKISRADELWDLMPLTQVSDILDVPVRTLRAWSMKDWIDTEREWDGGYRGGRSKIVSPEPVVEMYLESDLTMKEVADSYGISRTTVGEYIKQYRNGEL